MAELDWARQLATQGFEVCNLFARCPRCDLDMIEIGTTERTIEHGPGGNRIVDYHSVAWCARCGLVAMVSGDTEVVSASTIPSHWEAMTPAERTGVLDRHASRVFEDAMRKLEAAGHWLSMAKEASFLAQHLRHLRAIRTDFLAKRQRPDRTKSMSNTDNKPQEYTGTERVASPACFTISARMAAELIELQSADNGTQPASAIPKKTRDALIDRKLVKPYNRDVNGNAVAHVVITQKGRVAASAAKACGYPDFSWLDLPEDREDLDDIANGRKAGSTKKARLEAQAKADAPPAEGAGKITQLDVDGSEEQFVAGSDLIDEETTHEGDVVDVEPPVVIPTEGGEG